MPDRAKIISKLSDNKSAFPKGGALGAISEKEAKALGEMRKMTKGVAEEISEPSRYGIKRAGKSMSSGSISPKLLKSEPLPTAKDKEEEVEDLLTESEKEMEKQAEYASKEKANYDRIKKQGMSDQGIVSPEQLVEAGKKAYRKVKSKVKSMME
jgi:hypothetical protein